jgi:hypothetical protein
MQLHIHRAPSICKYNITNKFPSFKLAEFFLWKSRELILGVGNSALTPLVVALHTGRQTGVTLAHKTLEFRRWE